MLGFCLLAFLFYSRQKENHQEEQLVVMNRKKECLIDYKAK